LGGMHIMTQSFDAVDRSIVLIAQGQMLEQCTQQVPILTHQKILGSNL